MCRPLPMTWLATACSDAWLETAAPLTGARIANIPVRRHCQHMILLNQQIRLRARLLVMFHVLKRHAVGPCYVLVDG